MGKNYLISRKLCGVVIVELNRVVFYYWQFPHRILVVFILYNQDLPAQKRQLREDPA